MAQFDSYIRILRASLLPDQFDDFFTVTDQSWNELELDHKGPIPKMGFYGIKASSPSRKKLGTRQEVRYTNPVQAYKAI